MEVPSSSPAVSPLRPRKKDVAAHMSPRRLSYSDYVFTGQSSESSDIIQEPFAQPQTPVIITSGSDDFSSAPDGACYPDASQNLALSSEACVASPITEQKAGPSEQRIVEDSQIAWSPLKARYRNFDTPEITYDVTIESSDEEIETDAEEGTTQSYLNALLSDSMLESLPMAPAKRQEIADILHSDIPKSVH